MNSNPLTRRKFLQAMGTAAGIAAASPLLNACAPLAPATPQAGRPLKIGVLLPYSDIYAVLGDSITAAMELYFDQVGNEAGGRSIELIKEDTEIKPDVAQQKARKLVEQDQVDLVTGVVSSGVLMGLRDYFDASRALLIGSNAGANPLSRGAKTPYIWRVSFTNWMPNWPVGAWAYENVGKRAVISVPDYVAGENVVTSFSNSFQAAGGEVLNVQRTPFPSMGDPAPFIADLANAGADLVYAFYAGSAAVTFVKAYQEFGLADQLPLLGPGFTVAEDVLPAQGDAALGVRSGMHWALLLDNAENQAFKAAYKERTGKSADVYAVQGYDAARVIVEMVDALEGDTGDVDKMVEVLGGIAFKSPRGDFALDEKSQAPRHDIYLREVAEVDGAYHNTVAADLGEIVDPGDESKG